MLLRWRCRSSRRRWFPADDCREQLPDPILFAGLLSKCASPGVLRQQGHGGLQVVTALNLLVVAPAAPPIRYGLDEVAGENFGGHGMFRSHRIILKNGHLWAVFAYDATASLQSLDLHHDPPIGGADLVHASRSHRRSGHHGSRLPQSRGPPPETPHAVQSPTRLLRCLPAAVYELGGAAAHLVHRRADAP